MLSAFSGLFKKQKKDDPNIIRFLRGEECIGFWDNKAHALHFNDEVIEGDVSVGILANEKGCYVDDQASYIRKLVNDVWVKVGYISTNGEVLSTSKNQVIGMVAPYLVTEEDHLLRYIILHCAGMVFLDELPIPEENEYTQRVKAMEKNGALFQANLTMVDLWLKTNKEKMIIYKNSMVGHETLLSRMIACIDGDKIKLKEDSTYKGLGEIAVALRERGDPQTIELDEKVELVEVDALGGLTIVRIDQLFSFLPTKTLKYIFYSSIGEIVGHIEIINKHVPYSPIVWDLVETKSGKHLGLRSYSDDKFYNDNFNYMGRAKTDGSIYLEKGINGSEMKAGAIDSNGVIHQFHDSFTNEVIGKVEPLPKQDQMVYLADAAKKLFFPFRLA